MHKHIAVLAGWLLSLAQSQMTCEEAATSKLYHFFFNGTNIYCSSAKPLSSVVYILHVLVLWFELDFLDGFRACKENFKKYIGFSNELNPPFINLPLTAQ